MNIYDIAISYLPFYMQNGENIQHVYKAIAKIFKDILDFYSEIKLFMDIDQASGMGLDKIGNRIGEERLGRDDETYRMALKTRILINKSYGDIETINEVARTFLNGYFIGIQETWHSAKYSFLPATMVLKLKAGASLQAMNLIDETRAGGIKIFGEIEFKQPESDLYVASCLVSGEELVVYPYFPRNIESEGKIYVSTGNNTGLENVAVYPRKEVI